MTEEERTVMKQARVWLHMMVENEDIDPTETEMNLSARDRESGEVRPLFKLRLSDTLDGLDKALGDKIDPGLIEALGRATITTEG